MPKSKSSLFAPLVGLLLLLSCSISEANTISLVGLDDDGKTIAFDMDESSSADLMGLTLNQLSEGALLAANKETAISSNKFKLKTMWVGASMAASLGLGPVIKAKAAPGFFLMLGKK